MNRGVPNARTRVTKDPVASNVVPLPTARAFRIQVAPPARSRHLLWEALLFGVVALELHALVFFWFERNAHEAPPRPPAPIEITFVAPPPPPLPEPPPPPPVVEPKPLPPVAQTLPKPAAPKPKPRPVPKPKPAPLPAPAENVAPLETVPLPVAPAETAPAAEPGPPAPPAPEPVTEAHSNEQFGNPKPEYPAIARRRGWEGKVLVKVHVLENGRADAVELAQTSGHDVLDHSALATVANWRFVPAARGKTTFASWVTISVTFKLEN